MKKFTLFLFLLTIPSLACGVSAQLPPVIPPETNTPHLNETVVNTIQPTPTPRTMEIMGGCWNTRSSASLGDETEGDNITGIICEGSTVTLTGKHKGGWVETEVGWICNRGLGGFEVCE